MADRRRFGILLAALAFPAFAVLVRWEPAGLSAWGFQLLLILVAALILWATDAIPVAATCFVVLALMGMLAPDAQTPSIQTALAGFATASPLFVVASVAIGAATVKSGLARRIAALLVNAPKGSSNRLVATDIAIMPPSCLLLPSVLTRVAILMPAYERIYRRHGVRQGDRLPKFLTQSMAVLQPMLATAVLNGTAWGIVAASVLDVNSWGRWFALMAVPMLAITLLCAAVLYIRHRPDPLAPAASADDAEPDVGRMTGAEWKAATIILFTTVFWMSDVLHELSPAVPALVGAVALVAPVIGVLTWDEFQRAAPWTIFIVVATSISLSLAMRSSGLVTWLADNATQRLPIEGLELVPAVLALVGLMAVLSFVMPMRASFVAITIPICTALAQPMHLDPRLVGSIVVIVGMTSVITPVQTTTTLITIGTGHYTRRDLLVNGALFFAVSVVALFVVVLPWWALLGESMR